MKDECIRMEHLETEQLHAGLAEIGRSPQDRGTLQLIVRRPSSGEREVIDAGELDPAVGLVGDSWRARLSPAEAADPAVADARTNPQRRSPAMPYQDTSATRSGSGGRDLTGWRHRPATPA